MLFLGMEKQQKVDKMKKLNELNIHVPTPKTEDIEKLSRALRKVIKVLLQKGANVHAPNQAVIRKDKDKE